MKEITCCFTGHRHIAAEDILPLKELLRCEVEKRYASGKRVFCAGGALGFDTLAAEAVLALKEKHGNVKLLLFLPYKDQAKAWCEADRLKYEKILKEADGVSYASSEYVPQCMFTRNRQLCDASSACIAFLDRASGGTFYTVKYARQNGLEIVNLAKKLRGIDDEN